MSTQVIQLESLSLDLEQSWEEIVTSHACNPSSLPGWIRVVQGALDPKGNSMSVFIDRGEDGSIQGIVPYFVEWKSVGGLPMRVLQLATNRVSYHVQLVAIDPRRTLARFLDRVRGWDLLHAANVVMHTRTFDALRDLGGQHPMINVANGERSPYVPLEGSWPALIASKGKKFRYKLRKRTEAFRSDASWNMVWMSEVASDALLDAIFSIEKKSWKALQRLDIPSRPQEAEYHRRLIPYLRERDWLFGNVLYRDKIPVAYSLCCHVGDWIGQLKTSFDMAFEEHSPGAIVIDACIERAFEMRAKEFDFLGDATQHKLAWTDHVRDHVDVFIANKTALGRSYAALKRLRKPTDAIEA